MYNKYEEAIKRFAECRKEKSAIQSDVSKMLGITQSKVSKYELRKTILNNETLSILYSSGWDIDYIITGCKSNPRGTSLKGSFEKYFDIDDIYLKNLIYIGLVKAIKKCKSEERNRFELEVLNTLEHNNEPKTVFYVVRKMTGKRQDILSETLGISEKKCRRLDRGEIYPDAQLLIEICEIYGCRPSLFLQIDSVEWDIIDNVWNDLDQDIQMQVFDFIENGMKMLQGIGTND